jgi:hypothetical protein
MSDDISRYARANIKFQMQLARLREAAMPFAAHDWMDADLEDDNCKLTKGSGPITVGHWRALRAAIAALEPKP